MLILLAALSAAAQPATGTPEANADPAPQQVVLGESWPLVTVRLGQVGRFALRAADGAGPIALTEPHPRWRVVDGGLLVIAASRADVGLRRLSLRVGEGERAVHTGVIVRVVDPLPAPPAWSPPPPAPRQRYFRQCFLTIGGQAGFSQNAGADWSLVGLPDRVPSGSLMGAVSCARGQGLVAWTVGAETAPTYFYLAPGRGQGARRYHLLSGSAGLQTTGERLQVGAFLQAGVIVASVGARVAWLPAVGARGARHGVELRALRHLEGVAGALSLGYTFNVQGGSR